MEEATKLFRAFVDRGAPPPASLLQTYEECRSHLGLSAEPLIDRLVAAGADLHAVETAMRCANPRNGLTTRAVLMLAIAECRPEFQQLFTLTRPGRISAWLILISAPMAGAWALLKGTILLQWYGRNV